MRTLTGRLTVTHEDSRYAPHTSTGLAAPPYKTFLTASKRLLAQYELRRTRRDGTARPPARRPSPPTARWTDPDSRGATPGRRNRDGLQSRTF
jgi:hypothetical protein